MGIRAAQGKLEPCHFLSRSHYSPSGAVATAGIAAQSREKRRNLGSPFVQPSNLTPVPPADQIQWETSDKGGWAMQPAGVSSWRQSRRGTSKSWC